MQWKRVGALFILGGLVAASFAASPAQAGGAKRCAKYRPHPIVTDSPKAKSAPDLPVVKVTDAATAKDPLVIEFDQQASVWWYAHLAGRGPIIDGNEYFNVQVDSKKPYTGLHVRLEWDIPVMELDLYLWSYSTFLAWSEAANMAPEEVTGASGGLGYEYISGYPAQDCQGFTIENNAMWTAPQKARVKVWLGPVGWNG